MTVAQVQIIDREKIVVDSINPVSVGTIFDYLISMVH